MLIREMQPKELEQALIIDNAILEWEGMSLKRMTRCYGRSNCIALVATEEEATDIYGFAFCSLQVSWGTLDRIAIKPAFQRLGYGSRLLQTILERPEIKERRGIVAVSPNHYENAIGFLQKNGFGIRCSVENRSSLIGRRKIFMVLDKKKKATI